ncbi:hypothetical protein RAS_12520 [Rickettsia asiatica]|uniref:Uncharacterized protein n=1 Tax=Rickettsia asiatica TaxID=238800 RepID=A0A510G8E4_9RICK|nr:hypothetical protein [Rickettsia asiatica]BBJ32143.1 hypothetical protein RAS_12520 [Rickettsia asiatica]
MLILLIYTPLLWPEEKAFSITQNIGEPAVILGEKTGADIFVLLNYVQMIKTNGARTRDFLMSAFGCSVSNADNIFMSIGIVEAKSGRILWTNATPQAQPFSSSIFSSHDKSEIGNFHAVINMLLSPLYTEFFVVVSVQEWLVWLIISLCHPVIYSRAPVKHIVWVTKHI